MALRDTINGSWSIGGRFYAQRKKFVKYSNIIPNFIINIDSDEEDIEGWTVRAYFKKPNFVSTDSAILDTSVVSNGQVEFNLGGNKFNEYGVWNVELVLVGVSGENIGTVNDIYYDVVSNVEGDDTDLEASAEITNTVGELIEKLNVAVETSEEQIILLTEQLMSNLSEDLATDREILNNHTLRSVGLIEVI